jgi:SAM-dependent methyltransferase
MDFASSLNFIADLPIRVRRRFRGDSVDYRKVLFEDLQRRLGGRKPRRILEIGPKDGKDTRRLASLGAGEIVLVDLPNQKSEIEGWLPTLSTAPIELIIGNFMYDEVFNTIEPFDVVWCTGVLYHNPEQLRFIRQLFDVTGPDGVLVIETATARRAATRNDNCVEIWFPPDKAASRNKHLSVNVTHLPSARAVESWLQMIGFLDIERSDCHRRVTRSLAADRVAFTAIRKSDAESGSYYGISRNEFPIGRAR